MTSSFLALTWRRLQLQFQNSEQRDDSLETRETPPSVAVDKHKEQRTDEFDQDFCYVRIPRNSHAPSTPEGLRPRQRCTQVSAELGLLSGSVPPFTGVEGNIVTSYAVLPPWPNTASWTTTQDNGIMMTFSSPGSTDATSPDGTEVSAESPHLMPGQARTAVGAAIVAFQQQQQQLAWPRKAQNGAIQQLLTGEKVSPKAVEHQPPKQSDWDDVYSTTTREEDTTVDDGDFENEQPAYYKLHTTQDDPITNARSPLCLTKAEANNNSKRLLASPISTSTSLLRSPSSLPSKNTSYSDYEFSDEPRCRLISKQQQHDEHYDFGPLVPPQRVAWMEQHTNCNDLSGITLECHPRKSTSRTVVAHDANDKYETREPQKEDFFPQLDGSLLQAKSQNQRRYKEKLILAAISRLQDDLEVIADVEAVTAVGVDDEWLFKTPLNEEGLLTGFPVENRVRISNSLTTILKTMDTARPEVFFLQSPSEIPQYEDIHDDLREALLFTRRLVELAVPDKPVQYYKFRRSTVNLGVLPAPCSPAARGGDTSLFSLPSDSMAETPMTSNVSLTTTITSAVSPRGMRGGKSTTTNATSTTSPAPDGLVVRRTIEILTTILNKMSASCKELIRNDTEEWSLSSQESIRVTENLKRCYFQLLAVQDLPSVIESFEEYNDDDVAGNNTIKSMKLMTRNMVLPPPPPSLLFRAPAKDFFEPHFSLPPIRANCELSATDSSGSSVISAPNTLDMGTTVDEEEEEDYGVDDLRRQIGSSDYDDRVEERDGPTET